MPPPPLPTRPSPTSSSVLRARTQLTPPLSLPTLLSTLKSLSFQVQQAQSKTSSFPRLHSRLQRTSLTTLRLADLTHTTLTSFRTACLTSLDNLDLIHDLLCDNQSTVAKTLLSGEAATAARLATQSRTLALQFEEAAMALGETLAVAVETRASQDARRKLLAERVADSWLKLRNAKEEKLASSQMMSEAGELYREAEQREEGARWKGNVLQAANAAAVVGSVVSTRSTNLGLVGMGCAAGLAASIDGAVLRAREERAVHLKNRMDAREGFLKSGREVVEWKERLKSVRAEEEIVGEVLEGIEGAAEAMRILGGEMLKAEGFWRSVGEGIRGGGGVVQGVGVGWEVWGGERGGKRIAEVQAGWVALVGICEECIQGVGDAKGIMYKRIGDGGSESGELKRRRGEKRRLVAIEEESGHVVDDGSSLRETG